GASRPEREEPDGARVLDDDGVAMAQLALHPVTQLSHDRRVVLGSGRRLPRRRARIVDRDVAPAQEPGVEVDDPARLAEPGRIRAVCLDRGLWDVEPELSQDARKQTRAAAPDAHHQDEPRPTGGHRATAGAARTRLGASTAGTLLQAAFGCLRSSS